MSLVICVDFRMGDSENSILGGIVLVEGVLLIDLVGSVEVSC